MEDAASDFSRLTEIQREIERLESEQEALEREWLELITQLENLEKK
jgi:septal ring factor EnvC (AmiA/AmiB activator)